MRMSPYNDLLTRASRSADAVIAAVADNCRFDERASDARWEAFEAMLPAAPTGGTIEWQDWTEIYTRYSQKRCEVPRSSVPDAFLPANQDAWLEGPSENQLLVRIENISRPLRAWKSEFNSLVGGFNDLVDLLRRANEGDGDAGHAVRFFLDVWNQRRDARPAFTAFADEVQDELDDDDWPHALRDRLGLGHYSATDDAPLPIALMRYSLKDVLAAQTPAIASAVALPTVLDGGMHEFFFPAPRGHPYGATVHLVPDLADMLTAEVVHCRIDYEQHHIYRLGEISRPARMDDARLCEARDLHLYALREASGRDDFGEPLEGRT